MRDSGNPSLVEILADNTSKGITQRDLFPQRLERYGKAKTKALAISDYIRLNHPDNLRLSSGIRDCGSYLVFRDYYTVGEMRLSKACFCKKHLLCPLCAIRRGSKLISRYIDRWNAVEAVNGRLRLYMVTFTIKDGSDLLERFKHLQGSLSLYHKRRHRKGACEARKASAAVWSYEVKRGKGSGVWHPHVHAIWACETPPDQSAISEQWHNITGDSFIVDVRPIDSSDLVSGFLEVFKYAVKFSDQPQEDTWHCYQILKGRRLIGSFGDFYGIPQPDDLSDDPLEGLPYVEHFYQFFSGAYRFKSSS